MPENDFAIIDISTAFRAEKINFPSTTVKLFSPERSDGFLFLFSYRDCMRNLAIDYFCEWSFVVMITTVVVVIKCTRSLHRIVFRFPQSIYACLGFIFYFWVEIGIQRIIINLLDCYKTFHLWSAGNNKKMQNIIGFSWIWKQKKNHFSSGASIGVKGIHSRKHFNAIIISSLSESPH